MLVADQARFSQRGYKSADGRLNMAARDYPAQGGATLQLPLLMLHGLTRNARDFEPLIATLGADRRILVADQRGRGESENDPDPTNYRPDIYVDDMWCLLESAEVPRAIFIGTSMGGIMSMLMGVQRPERIAGLILNDIGPDVETEGLDRIRSYVGTTESFADWDSAAAACKAVHSSAMLDYSDGDWVKFAKRTCEQTEDGSIKYSYDPAISQNVQSSEQPEVPPDMWDVWEQLAGIPTLAIRGAKSDVLSRATVDRMHSRRAGQFTSVEVPDRGHAPILDEPIAFEAIQSFLADLP